MCYTKKLFILKRDFRDRCVRTSFATWLFMEAWFEEMNVQNKIWGEMEKSESELGIRCCQGIINFAKYDNGTLVKEENLLNLGEGCMLKYLGSQCPDVDNLL